MKIMFSLEIRSKPNGELFVKIKTDAKSQIQNKPSMIFTISNFTTTEMDKSVLEFLTKLLKKMGSSISDK